MKFNLNIEDIKYLKILYKDENGQPSTIKVAMKKIEDSRVTACMRTDEDLNIKTPQEVTLSIVCSDGLYRTKTKLLYTSFEQPYLFIYLEPPTGLEYQQNREYFRIMADFDASYYVNIDENFENYTTKIYDISANGVSIILPTHAVSEDDAEIDMMINERIVHAKIQYIRSEKLNDGYKISFTYSEISNSDRDYISSACIQRQLQNRRTYGS